jgi:hypothetical protein
MAFPPFSLGFVPTFHPSTNPILFPAPQFPYPCKCPPFRFPLPGLISPSQPRRHPFPPVPPPTAYIIDFPPFHSLSKALLTIALSIDTIPSLFLDALSPLLLPSIPANLFVIIFRSPGFACILRTDQWLLSTAHLIAASY